MLTLPVQITERIQLDEATRERIREKASKLTRYFERLTACRVTVDQPHRKQHSHNPFEVVVEISAPHADMIAHGSHESDLNVAIRDAFEAARRQVEVHGAKVRGEVKHHEHPPTAAETDTVDEEE